MTWDELTVLEKTKIKKDIRKPLLTVLLIIAGFFAICLALALLAPSHTRSSVAKTPLQTVFMMIMFCLVFEVAGLLMMWAYLRVFTAPGALRYDRTVVLAKEVVTNRSSETNVQPGNSKNRVTHTYYLLLENGARVVVFPNVYARAREGQACICIFSHNANNSEQLLVSLHE